MASLATAWVDIVPRFKDLSSTFNRELRGIDATGAGSRLGSQLGDGLTAGAKTGGTKLSDMLTGVTKSAVTGFGKIGKVGLGAITTIGGGITALAAKGGFARALNIENAQAKLKGLGHSAETIGEIMANANLAVKGTAYGLDEAASVAAAAVASGIKPGEQLTQVLKTVGDTAQIVGMGFSDAGAIFTSVMARGKLQGDDMLQLTSRGVPVLQALSDQLGVSTQDVSEMVSKGKVDFQTFVTALDKYLGGSALAAGETFSGAMANVKAALSRVGQKAATPALNALRDTFNVLTPAIDKVNTALEPLADKLGTRLSNAVQTVTPWIQRFADGMADGSITIQDIAKHVGLLVGAFGGFTALGQFGPQILDVFTTAGNGSGALVSLVSGNMGKIRGVVSGAGGLFTDLGTRWGNAMGLIDANFGGVFGMMANRARSGLSGIGTTMVGLFDSKIYLPLQQGIGGIGAKMAAPFQALAGRVGGFLSPVTSAFGTAFQGFGTTLAAPIQAGLSGIGNLFLNFFNPANFLKYFGLAAILGALVLALGALNTSLSGQLQTYVTEFLTITLPGIVTRFQTWVAEQLPVLMQSGLTLLTSVIQGITANLPQLLTTATMLLTTLVDGIANALPTLIPAAMQMVTTLVQGIVANLPRIIESGLNLLTKFVEGIINAIPQLIATLPRIITSFIDGILGMLPRIMETGVNLLLKFVNGVVNAIPQLVAALPRIISGFVNGIARHLPQILQTGITLLGKLVVGIIQAIPPDHRRPAPNHQRDMGWPDLGGLGQPRLERHPGHQERVDERGQRHQGRHPRPGKERVERGQELLRHQLAVQAHARHRGPHGRPGPCQRHHPDRLARSQGRDESRGRSICRVRSGHRQPGVQPRHEARHGTLHADQSRQGHPSRQWRSGFGAWVVKGGCDRGGERGIAVVAGDAFAVGFRRDGRPARASHRQGPRQQEGKRLLMLTNHQRIRGLNLDKSHLTIDGKPLSDYAVFAVAGGIVIGEAKPVTMFQSAPGRSGGWDVTLDDQHGYPAVQRREITVQVAATGDSMEIGESKTLIGGYGGRNVRVGGLTDYGEFHGRLSVGAWEDNRDMMATLKWSACTLTLDADPHTYGTMQRIDLPLDGKAVHARILGNRPTYPVLHQLVDEKVDGVTPVATPHTFTVNNQSVRAYSTLKGAGLWDETHVLLLDCESRRTTWQGEAIPIAIDDYPSMSLGPATFAATITPKTNVKSYSQYVTYTPRWLI